MHPKRALVTGGTGFVGSNLVRGLLERGWSVDCVVRPSSDTGMFQSPERLGIHLLTGGTGGLIGILERARPDVVFHLASRVQAAHGPADIEALISSNVLFGTQLLEAMCETGASRIVDVGSGFQHYHSADYRPVCLYAATKQAFQDICAYYVDARGLSAVTLILNDTYGPDDPRPKVVPLLMRAALTGETLPMTPGEQEIELLHVDDVVAGLERAARMLLAGELAGGTTFGLAPDRPITVSELVTVVERVTGRPLRAEFGAIPYRPREVMTVWHGDRVLPGWAPSIALEDGLARVWAQLLPDRGGEVV